jgi:peptidoglycan/xylan/chitin deacetylase (PgdA/CDA1 family)
MFATLQPVEHAKVSGSQRRPILKQQQPTPTPTEHLRPFLAHLPNNLNDARNALMSVHHFLYAGAPAYHEIALTFDDGPSPTYTEQILSILHRSKVKATFFLLGAHARSHPEMVRHIHTEGHLIGNHTWNHPELTMNNEMLIQKEMQTTSQQIADITGSYPEYFRPPYGSYNYNTLKLTNKLGLSTILWNIDTNDWQRRGTQSIFQEATRGKNGSIILMHDGGGDRSQTVAALPSIIEYYKKNNFHFVTIQEMIAHFPQHYSIPTSNSSSP